MAKTKKNSVIADKTIKLMKERSKKRSLAKSKPKSASKPKLKPRPAAKAAPVRTEAVKPVGRASYSKDDLAFFRSIIIDKKKEILGELETLRDTMMDSQTGEYATENSTYSTHMEQGTDAMEREKTFLFASREGKFLNHLEDALARIDRGEYGRCSGCGKLIEKERLEAVPHAQQCLQCKLKLHK